MKLIIFIITNFIALNVKGQFLDQPINVGFTPNAMIRSIDGLTSSMSWRILASYNSAPNSTNNNIEEEQWSIPILFFPSKGTSRLDSGSHPCIISPRDLCCLFDFMDQYTSVGFYKYLEKQKDWFNRTSCSDINLDFRPFMKDLMKEDMILNSLDGINDTSIQITNSFEDEMHDIDIRIPHIAMKNLFSSSNNDKNISDKLYTSIGFMWLRILPGMN
jgi:hypothetical protein